MRAMRGTRRARRWAPVAAVVLCAWGCGDAGGGDRDATDPGGLPALLRECGACHDLAALARPADGAGVSPWAFAGQAAEGLVRVDPMFPEPGAWRAVPWPRRGSHPGGGTCDGCHPVQADGTGHGLRVYPDAAAVFAGGTDCAAACHGWVGEAASGAGFPGSDAPAVTGTARPGALLAAGSGGHSNLWREGARPADPASFRIGAFRPGCGGCHNLMAEDHGAILGCLDCHDFVSSASEIHAEHVAAAVDGQARFDPQGAAAGLAACDYCHAGEAAGPAERSRRACRNCHLSGHAPVGTDGRPQFWPLGD